MGAGINKETMIEEKIDKEIEIIDACCIDGCNKIKATESIWIVPKKEYYEKWYNEFRFSHGYCPQHFIEAEDEIRKYKNSCPNS